MMIRAVLLVAAAARAGAASRPIFQRGLTHETLAVDLDAATTIDDVKHQLYELEEIPLAEQRLVYVHKNRQLAGDERLAALGGATILLFRKTPGREPRVWLETPLLDATLRKVAVSYDRDDGTLRVEYVNGTVIENLLDGKWVQTEPDGSTYDYPGIRFPGPRTKDLVNRRTDNTGTAYFYDDGSVYREYFNGTTAAVDPFRDLGRVTHANGSIVASYYKDSKLYAWIDWEADALALQKFVGGATVPFNASSPTYRAFVDRWGSEFHRMLDADTFRQVVANDFRILALISLVAGSWLAYAYLALIFLCGAVPPFYYPASAAWWVSGPVRRRALDACRTWTGLLATLVCCAVGGTCLSALGGGWIERAITWMDDVGFYRNLAFVVGRLCAPLKGMDDYFDDNRRLRSELRSPTRRFDVGLLLRAALLATHTNPLLLAKHLAMELFAFATVPNSTLGWAMVAVRACLAVVGASWPARIISREFYYGSAAHSTVITWFAMMVAYTVFPLYPVLCLLGAVELLVSVYCYFNDDGLLGVFAAVVRGVLWPAQAVNKLLAWVSPRIDALCKRGDRAFGKAVDDDVQDDDDDESDDVSRSEEPAFGGSERSGLASFEEATEEAAGTALADYWWLCAFVAAAVFYWHVPPSFALWPLLARTWGYAVWGSNCFCGWLVAFGAWYSIGWPIPAVVACGYPYLWYQLGGPLAAAWRVASYFQSAGWCAMHALLSLHLFMSLIYGSTSDTSSLRIAFIVTVATLAGICVLDGLGDDGTIVRLVAREVTVMREPVLAADGFTYDRHAIAAWLARGKTTSPTTGAPLAHTHLTPNHLVKSMIAEYQSSYR